MSKIDRTRSPHVKLQEFIDCFLQTDHKKELENFSEPRLTRSTREKVPDEALRYLALLLLYGLNERVKDISIIRKEPGEATCRMSGERFYDIPRPSEEVISCLFDEIKEMAGMDETKRVGKLVLGLKNEEIDLNISSTLTDSSEEKIMIQLPQLA
ncbi:MAG: hypothetical protein HQ583_09860 [Candidatus Abyssubacteria bacterium]|nr:hypothetical protein [Candidatus Abyssubacteria bacterium]